MIPDTLVGLAIFAATAAPGRIYERRAEQRSPRPPRSTTSEIVELVAFGQMATLVALLLVALVFDLIGVIDVGALIDAPKDYAEDQPARVLVGVLTTLAASYAIADAAARALFPALSGKARERSGGFSPYTTWFQVLWEGRPSERHGAIATIELKNGFRITGRISNFTAEDADNRELALGAPIVMRSPGGTAKRYERGDFVLLREDEIRFIAGRYVEPGG